MTIYSGGAILHIFFPDDHFAVCGFCNVLKKLYKKEHREKFYTPDAVVEPDSSSQAPCWEWDTPREQADLGCVLELLLYSTHAIERHTTEAEEERDIFRMVSRGAFVL